MQKYEHDLVITEKCMQKDDTRFSYNREVYVNR